MRKLSITATLAIALIVSAGSGQGEASRAITGAIRATVDYGPVPRAPSNSVEHVLLRRQSEPEGELHQVRPDEAGIFVLENISAGRWDLALHASDDKYHKFMTYGVAEVRAGAAIFEIHRVLEPDGPYLLINTLVAYPVRDRLHW